ncbi:hypothetical protein Tco_0587638 [Tanacetum coccineum]
MSHSQQQPQQQVHRKTIKLVYSKYIIRFQIDQQGVDFALDTFGTVLRLPQATTNRDVSFVEALDFHVLVPFMISIGYDDILRYITDFKVKNLPQPWKTLFKIINRCTTTKIIGELLPYPRYAKLIINHILSISQDIPKRTNEPLHTPGEDNPITQIKIDFRCTKEKGVKIPKVLLNEVIKQTEAYKVYVEQFEGVEVPMIQPSPVAIKIKQKKSFNVDKPVPTTEEIDKANLQEAMDVTKVIEISKAEVEAKEKVEMMIPKLNKWLKKEKTPPALPARPIRASDNVSALVSSPTRTPSVKTTWGHSSRYRTTMQESKVMVTTATGHIPLGMKTTKDDASKTSNHFKLEAEATGHIPMDTTKMNTAEDDASNSSDPLELEVVSSTHEISLTAASTTVVASVPHPRDFSGSTGIPTVIASKPADPKLFELLKKRLEKTQVGSDTCRQYDLRKCSHDDNSDDNPEGENAKRRKTIEGTSSANGVNLLDDTGAGIQLDAQMDDNDASNLKQGEISSEKASQEFLEELKFMTSWGMRTIEDYYKMEETMNELLRMKCKNATEYDYHVEHVKCKVLDSLIVFTRSKVIWERVHDFQLGIESYQYIIKLTTPTLYCVLGKVKEINRNNERGFSNTPLSIYDREVMKIFDLEIEKHLKLHKQVRRKESFIGGRPITYTRGPCPE